MKEVTINGKKYSFPKRIPGNKIIVINPGHGGSDPGASGNGRIEKHENLVDGKLLRNELLKYENVTIYLTRETDTFTNVNDIKSLTNEITKEWGADNTIFVSPHWNATAGATGWEALYNKGGSMGKSLATSIHNAVKPVLSKVDLRDRGLKDRDNLAVLKSNPATCIIESCFIDTKSDVEKYVNNRALFIEAYAKGIADYGGLKLKAIEIPTETSDILYKVQVGAYSVKSNADNMVKDLADKGFKGYIVEEKREVQKPMPKKSEQFNIGNASIIKTKAENLEIKVLGKSLNKTNYSGVSGPIYDTQTAPVSSPNACVFIAVSNGKAISENAKFNGYNAPPRATIYLREDGRLGTKQVKSISDLPKDIMFAVGGFMVKPYMDFANEKIPSGVNYKTGHIYVGFDKDNNIYLIAKPYHTIPEIVPTLDKLGIISCVVLDGGGSTQMKYDGKNLFETSRAINTAIVLKEV